MKPMTSSGLSTLIADGWEDAPDATDRRRRPGYGPSTVPVGARGSLTRDRIVAETLTLFEGKGFPETSVRDIAQAAHISRPTLYQYFAGKEEIFAELMKECGSALLDLLDRVEPLGPTAEGFANLDSWLVEWAEIYGTFRIVFGQWNQVDLAGTTTQRLVRHFSRVYNAGVSEHLRRSGVTALEPRLAAVAITSIVNRFNYLLFVTEPQSTASPAVPAPGRSRATVREMAVVLQRLIFPDTPRVVLLAPVADASVFGSPAVPRPRGVPAARPASPPSAAQSAIQFAGRSPRSTATMKRIVDAAAACMAERGYHDTSVDDIVVRAGIARGTFYKYFEGKSELILTLSDECEKPLNALIDRFIMIPLGPSGQEGRRRWVADYLEFRRLYIGVMRCWIDRTPAHINLTAARHRVIERIDDLVQTVLRPSAAPVTPRAANVLLLGVLERLPDGVDDITPAVTDSDLVELMATAIERGLAIDAIDAE
ncbi:MAG: transcriptional regulator, TetR family [Pseudonocardiales bacterium]|nr:transcriptional regulator, TetR family [Pseudonocardiales bacterium]